MNWDAIGAIGEAIGAVAVVVTLLYVAMQIRQNTAAQETNSVWLMTQLSNQTHAWILENEAVAALAAAAQRGELQSDVESIRAYSLLMSIVNLYFAAWRAHKNGHLPDDVYEMLRSDSKILNAPGMTPHLANAFESRPDAFVEEFFSAELRASLKASIVEGSRRPE